MASPFLAIAEIEAYAAPDIPYVYVRLPDAGEPNAPLDTHVYIGIVGVLGITQPSTELWLDLGDGLGWQTAILAGVFQPGFDGPASSNVANVANGRDITVDLVDLLDYGRLVRVRIFAQDDNGYLLIDEWEWSTTTPQIETMGVLEGLTSVVGEGDNELGGLHATRLLSPASAGDTQFLVETVNGWPTAGQVAIEGVTYTYSGVSGLYLTGIEYTQGGDVKTGAKIDHRAGVSVLDLSANPESALSELRKAMLVDHAQAEDLNVIGRNLGVFRSPEVSTDDLFRALIKVLAYNPRATVWGIQLVLDTLLGVGNYELFEDLVNHPNEVFVRLSGLYGLQDNEYGQAYLDDQLDRPALTDTTLALPEEPLGVHAVRWKDEAVDTDCRTAKPSVQTVVEYSGGAPVQVWEYQGADEGVDVQLLTADGGCIEFATAAASSYYRHTARVVPESRAILAALMGIPSPNNLSATNGLQAGLEIDQGERRVIAGIRGLFAGDNPTYELGFCDSTGALYAGSPKVLAAGAYYSVTIKIEDGTAKLLVDGQVVETRAVSGFSAGTDHQAVVGKQAAVADPDLRVRHIYFEARTLTDYWASRGSAGSVLAASPTMFDTNLVGHFVAGDVGKYLRVSGGTASRGRNNGLWEISLYVDDERALLEGQVRGDGEVEDTDLSRVHIDEFPQAFRYPDDLGKTLVVSNSSAGNDGSYTITKLLERGTGVDLDSRATEIPQTTDLCEVSPPLAAAEAYFDWRVDPNFVDEAGLSWEMSNAGTQAGTALTLRQALPFTVGGYQRVLRVTQSQIYSAQILKSRRVANTRTSETPVTYAYYPLYLADPAAFIRDYLDILTAAGVIPSVVAE